MLFGITDSDVIGRGILCRIEPSELADNWNRGTNPHSILCQRRDNSTGELFRLIHPGEMIRSGGTRKEQVVAFLKTCGVTDETMNKIRDILLEPIQ